jgi:hypothetical protein
MIISNKNKINNMPEKKQTLEEACVSAFKSSLFESIERADFVTIDHRNKISLPKDFLEEIWQSIDIESVKVKIKERLEDELANKLVNHMAAEIATDIKSVLSIKERREAIRGVVRNNIDQICNPK